MKCLLMRLRNVKLLLVDGVLSFEFDIMFKVISPSKILLIGAENIMIAKKKLVIFTEICCWYINFEPLNVEGVLFCR